MPFSLYEKGVKLKKLVPKPENEAFRKTEVSNLLLFLATRQSRKDNLLSFSVSKLNLMLGC